MTWILVIDVEWSWKKREKGFGEVLDLEIKQDVYAVEILRLKKRVKRLERQRKSSTSQPRRRKYRQVKSSDDDLNEEDASK
ncbi:hypothetical protein Tco_0445443 [Tanacetum coccineum]